MTRTLVVGPGRVGRSLALAHHRNGDEVRLVGRSAGEWQDWARAEGIGETLSLEACRDFRPELVVLAVPDQDVEQAAAACAEHLDCDGVVFVHVSGIHDLDVLKAATLEGGFPAAMHPVLQFVEPERDLKALRHAVVVVTAAPNAREETLRIAQVWGAQPVRLKPGVDRRRYHLGLALASNHLTALLAWAAELLEPAFGEESWDVVALLARQAMVEARNRGPFAALTGPVARGDVETVREHLEGLDEDERRRYAALLDVVVDLAERSRRLDADRARELRALAGRFA